MYSKIVTTFIVAIVVMDGSGDDDVLTNIGPGAGRKVRADQMNVAACMKLATTKKNAAFKLAQKTYSMVSKQAKGKEGKTKKSEAKEVFKKAQKAAKAAFAAERKVCTSRASTTPEPAVGRESIAEKKVVTYTNAGYSPVTLRIKVGETVTFTNQSLQLMWTASAVHPTHSTYPTTGGCLGSTFDACNGVQSGDSWSFGFDIAGTWEYHNHLNPGDSGTIIVE